ncbi:MAG: S26 family signal peptidase [Candidatus Saccharimonadales bacterium]
MLFVRRVAGDSMLPYLRSGETVICITNPRYTVGDIVIAKRGDIEVIKRITKIEQERLWIEGDNSSKSTDSRQFGWIDKSDILGSMKYSLPFAVDPPKLRARQGALLGWIAAAILIALSLVHLFRIDTFVPEVTRIFDGDASAAFWVSSVIVTMEVFALPFLMRMKLSPLAQYVSGAFAVLVPLSWLLISIWTYGQGVSTAQLGEFVDLPSSWLLIGVNTLWLLFSYYVIWALGYDHKPREQQSFVTRLFARLSK